MKLSKFATLLSLSLFACASVNAANTSAGSVSKKITLTAQISDSIYVSKPDGTSWYNTEELEADDNMQKHFSKMLPFRVWSKSKDFKISLAQPLILSNGHYDMLNTKVIVGTPLGDIDVKYGAGQTITQPVGDKEGFDSVYNVVIETDAPVADETQGSPSTIGSYSGDLVMLFEPSAAAAS